MIPIFDRSGTPVGWLDEDRILDIHARHRAFIERGAVFSYEAVYLGTFGYGLFRDKYGAAVAFVPGASGVLLPLTKLPPIPPLPPFQPFKPIPPLPPIPSLPSLSWSGISWEQFLRGT